MIPYVQNGTKYCNKMVLAPENKWLSEKLLGFSSGEGGDLRLGRIKWGLLGERVAEEGLQRVAGAGSHPQAKRVFPKRFKVRGQGEEKGWESPAANQKAHQEERALARSLRSFWAGRGIR